LHARIQGHPGNFTATTLSHTSFNTIEEIVAGVFRRLIDSRQIVPCHFQQSRVVEMLQDLWEVIDGMNCGLDHDNSKAIDLPHFGHIGSVGKQLVALTFAIIAKHTYGRVRDNCAIQFVQNTKRA